MSIRPEILATFRWEGDRFISRESGGFATCPPYLIASTAISCVRWGMLDLPDGYDLDVLETIKFHTGFLGEEVRISPRQAAELAQIGKRILGLQAEGKIDPPLNNFEEQSITHLVDLVGSTLG